MQLHVTLLWQLLSGTYHPDVLCLVTDGVGDTTPCLFCVAHSYLRCTHRVLGDQSSQDQDTVATEGMQSVVAEHRQASIAMPRQLV